MKIENCLKPGMGWLRDGSIPLRFQGVSQLSCVQTNNKKELGRPAPARLTIPDVIPFRTIQVFKNFVLSRLGQFKSLRIL